MELEQLLSPEIINFLVYRNTLIEEHIVGIPGDVFINRRLESLSMQDKRALAKEYIKFNEALLPSAPRRHAIVQLRVGHHAGF